ncbi:plasmid mobilization relaxosome protein MobC [Kordiimonas sp. SCSIO 12603]|uniref:plasmid mobilization protein n=1 Tax=Kordiimonas sp. SCSIO 12603 TaxID=2829596 RepID=UPI002106BA44|nr:plasmid mobilization relaxosome protein MobC [Kordiimonas sp. SCSIO 12603]UTW58848.1 plasmid mobilization relaxosome protein MobC [Kordiimonas sp. SCSIO 12603]
MARPKKIEKQPRPIRLYTYVSGEEKAQIQEAADMADLRISVFLRKLALAQQIRPAKSRQSQELIQALSKLGADLNRVGNNINQLAHAANMEKFPKEHVLLDAKTALDGVLGEITTAIKEA